MKLSFNAFTIYVVHSLFSWNFQKVSRNHKTTFQQYFRAFLHSYTFSKIFFIFFLIKLVEIFHIKTNVNTFHLIFNFTFSLFIVVNNSQICFLIANAVSLFYVDNADTHVICVFHPQILQIIFSHAEVIVYGEIT